MKKEKTKIILIARKCFSNFKLNVSQKLDWGCTSFTFLGLYFSVNLDDMHKINYSKTIKIAEAEIIKWQSRNLSPIDKITIITRGSLAKKKRQCFCIAKTKRPEKDIKVSAKGLRKCFVSSLILLWQPKSAQSALSSTVFKI